MCNNESDYITVSELRNIHEWRDNKTSYVYFKEKITGQTGRKGKKFEFSWLKTNDLYLEGGESVIQTEDKDYWISAAEVSIRITDDYGKPIWREKWVTSMPCHFLILDLDVAIGAENPLNKKNFPSLCDRITAQITIM